MPLKKIAVFLLAFTLHMAHSQTGRSDEFGKPRQAEFELEGYEAEPDAPGIILYESGNYYAIPIIKRTSVRLVKEIHRKIKVLDAKRFDLATIEIPFYEGNGYTGEEIKDYKAVTHNGPIQNFVPDNGFYKIQKSGVGNVLRFTFPNLQNGSILEYSYTIVSPYFFDLDGWEFQHELPTLYSKFQTNLPAHFRYNRILYGPKKLDVEKAVIKKNGFRLPSDSGFVDTELDVYAMTDIPSFIEESYMLSKKNYISRIVYEPLAFKAFYGFDQVYTRDWKDVDHRFEIRSDFGEQLKKKGYFRKKLPNTILDIEDDMERAMAVYSFIQDTYTWNGRYFNYGINVKEAFDDRKGSVTAINISLVNALEAAKLDAKAVILSTRKNGLPTELYPVLSNFNYVIAALFINGEKILLDATNKQAPFGILPFPALNMQGRVMDFKKGSYWTPIEPYTKNIHYANSQLTATETGDFTGKVRLASYGYVALGKRNAIAEASLQDYMKKQSNDKAGIEIDSYQVEDVKTIDNPLKEQYNIHIEPETVGTKVILYPFFNKTYLSENPFKMKQRSYPMDFGYPFTNTYVVSIDLGNTYEIEQLPENRSIKLPHEDGECSVTYVAEGSKINVRYNMKLNAYRFPSDAYESLKEFFGTIITILKEESIVLKKK